jgi:hypothetical protein
MFTMKHARTGAASLAALTALAFGGSAIATAAQSTPHQATPPVSSVVDTPTPGDTADAVSPDVATPGDTADNGADVATPGDKADGPDTDNVQSGDQTGADKADKADSAGSDTDNVQSGNQTGADTADSAGQ